MIKPVFTITILHRKGHVIYCDVFCTELREVIAEYMHLSALINRIIAKINHSKCMKLCMNLKCTTKIIYL